MSIELPQIKHSLILVALALLISSSARATDLSGKVTEVIDGNTISLKSLSHTIKVRLLAVAPPEKGQPYSDVARQHLSDLILGKYVVVRYTGIGKQGYLIGTVLLEQADINAQMLRDGVAWYFPPDADDLAEANRQLYPACEQAARAEKRGLWQAKDPVSPWEFRKRAEQNPYLSVPVQPTSTQPMRSIEGIALSSQVQLGSFSGPPLLLSKFTGKSDAPTIPPEQWESLKLLAGKHSFILVPTGGLRNSSSMALADGRIVELETYVGRSGKTVYVVVSSIAPNHLNDTDSMAFDRAMEEFLAAIKSDASRVGASFSCTPAIVQAVSSNFFYKVRQYDLRGCTISGSVLISTLWSANNRDVHLVAALNLDGKEDPNAKRFFKSLHLSRSDF
ncbi:MAG TPA: thermonuclease family protein [Pyrinomonadaceae bacterium]|nr:thermonuclease family protein [Pyrinomonadaceae bacterium]